MQYTSRITSAVLGQGQAVGSGGTNRCGRTCLSSESESALELDIATAKLKEVLEGRRETSAMVFIVTYIDARAEKV
jgi:hypothetical protein